jgi:hypothetical protein
VYGSAFVFCVCVCVCVVGAHAHKLWHAMHDCMCMCTIAQERHSLAMALSSEAPTRPIVFGGSTSFR